MVPPTVPDHILEDARRSGEVAVFEALRTTLRDDFHVFYSVPWTAPRPNHRARDGEADFIVVHPERGLLVIEVKGGRVTCQGGRWTSMDHDNVLHDIKDPFLQAEQSKYVLQNKLPGHIPEWQGVFILHGHAVIFPDCARSREIAAPHIVAELTSFAEDLPMLGRRIEAAFGYWRGNTNSQMALNAAQMRALVRYLQPSFELFLSPAALIRDAEEKIIRTTAQQMRVLDFITSVPRARIPGVAGSGKTLIAVERALRFARDGKRTLLTCFNRALAEELRARIPNEPNLRIRTYHHYCLEMAEKAGLEISAQPTDPEGLKRWYTDDHPEWLDEALRLLPLERYDAIVVDEGQDFETAWWVTLTDSLADPDNGPFYVFYDPAQAIFRPSSIPSELPEFGSLRENLRNAKPIAKLVQSIVSSEMSLNGPAGPEVEWHPVETPQDTKKVIKSLVHRLRADMGLSFGDIAVLTTQSPAKCGLGAEDLIGNIHITHDPTDTTKVLLATAQSFKGLERPAIILAGIERAVEQDHRHLLYVGMSRARVFLAILGSTAALTTLRHHLELIE